MQSTTTLELNLQYPNHATTMYAVQNDRLSRKISAVLADGATAWSPPTGSLAIVRFIKPDGTMGFYDTDENGEPAVTWTGNVATIMLAEQVLTVAGDVWCQVNFYNSGEERLSTYKWLIKVQPNVITDETIESTDYFNILTHQIDVIIEALADVPVPSTSDPLMDGNASPGSATGFARGDHIHPSDTSRVPTTRKVNNKPLSSDITLSASDVGAVPTSRTVNGKSLSSNATINASNIPNDSTVSGENVDDALDYLNGALNAIHLSSGSKVLLIGDSYNNGNGGISGQGWGYYFQQFTGCEATIVHQNGGGFAIVGNTNATYPNKTYAQCVSEISGEYNIVIAQSGWNDAGQATESQITTAVSSFVTAAREKWQNAKIYVISTNNGTDTTYTKANKLKAISNAALENDVVSSLYSPYWLIGKNVTSTDGIHLNDDGYQLLAHYIVDYVSGWDGVIEANNYYNAPNEDRIPPSTVTVGTNVNCYFNNSFCTISFDVTLTQTESSWVTTVQNLPIPRAYLIQTIGNWNATYQRPIRAEIGNDGTLRIRYGEAGNYRILMTYPL